MSYKSINHNLILNINSVGTSTTEFIIKPTNEVKRFRVNLICLTPITNAQTLSGEIGIKVAGVRYPIAFHSTLAIGAVSKHSDKIYLNEFNEIYLLTAANANTQHFQFFANITEYFHNGE